MGWTKQQLIDRAFSEIGMNPNVFNIDADAMETGLRTMDSFVASLSARGIRIGYLLPSSAAASDLAADSGIPDIANEAVYLGTALRLAPGIGKTLSPMTMLAAKQAMDGLMLAAAFPQQQQFPNTLPRGAGNKPWRSPNQNFMPTPGDPLVSAPGDDEIEFN